LRSSADVGVLFHRQRDRSRRVHSIISGAGYLLAAALLAGTAAGFIAVTSGWCGCSAAGIIAANLSERFAGRYL
jgi:hypothetical protein